MITEESIAVKTFSPDIAGALSSAKEKERSGSEKSPTLTPSASTNDETEEVVEVEKQAGAEKQAAKKMNFDEERDLLIENNRELMRSLGLDKIIKTTVKSSRRGRKKKAARNEKDDHVEAQSDQPQPQDEEGDPQGEKEAAQIDQNKSEHNKDGDEPQPSKDVDEPRDNQDTLRNAVGLESHNDQDKSSNGEGEPQVGNNEDTERENGGGGVDEGEDKAKKCGEDEVQDNTPGASDTNTPTNKHTHHPTSPASAIDSSVGPSSTLNDDSPMQDSNSSSDAPKSAAPSGITDNSLASDPTEPGKQATPTSTPSDNDSRGLATPSDASSPQGSDTLATGQSGTESNNSTTDDPMLGTSASDVTTTDALVGLPDTPTDFVRGAIDYLVGLSGDERWHRVVVTWACIEAALGYPGREVRIHNSILMKVSHGLLLGETHDFAPP